MFTFVQPQTQNTTLIQKTMSATAYKLPLRPTATEYYTALFSTLIDMGVNLDGNREYIKKLGIRFHDKKMEIKESATVIKQLLKHNRSCQ